MKCVFKKRQTVVSIAHQCATRSLDWTARLRTGTMDPMLHARLLALLSLLLLGAGACRAALPIDAVQVVHTYPHDTAAFTEGLFYLDGFLYESTGLEGHSSIRKVRLETGKVLKSVDIPAEYFGEGIVNWHGELVSLTWKSQIGFVFDLATFTLRKSYRYAGEGWALTQDGSQLIMSDGTPELRFLNPDTLRVTRRLQVTLEGRPLPNLNELEWVKGEILANVWHSNSIVRIDPHDGKVLGIIDLNGLLAPSEQVSGPDGVLNGIAYDAKGDRLFVTGKNWPKLFEVRLKPPH
jgi:glutamine cyclotransferase